MPNLYQMKTNAGNANGAGRKGGQPAQQRKRTTGKKPVLASLFNGLQGNASASMSAEYSGLQQPYHNAGGSASMSAAYRVQQQ